MTHDTLDVLGIAYFNAGVIRARNAYWADQARANGFCVACHNQWSGKNRKCFSCTRLEEAARQRRHRGKP